MIALLGRVCGAVSRGMVALIVLVIRGYQVFLGPVLGRHCRYEPSCSRYAAEALEVHGVVRGLALAVWRILRCNPWSGSGYDPVPPRRTRA